MSTLHTPALFRAPLPGKQKGGRTELKYLLPTGKEEGNPRVYFLFGAFDSDVPNQLSPSPCCAVKTPFTQSAEGCINRGNTVLELDNYPINLLT